MSRTAFCFFLALSLGLSAQMAVSGRILAQDKETETSERTPSNDRVGGGAADTANPNAITYELDFEGDADSAILDLLRSASQLESLADKPPASLAALKRRLEKDIEAFNKALRSQGYYANQLTSRIEAADGTQDVIVTVVPGPLFSIESYEVRFTAVQPAEPSEEQSAEGTPEAIAPSALGITPGMAARAADIVAAQGQAIRLLATRGFPRATVLEQNAVVDYATSTMSVTLQIDSGPAARFGVLSFSGLSDVEEDYLRDLAQWPRGNVFDRTEIAALRRTLSGTGLFSGVKVIEAETPDANGELAVVVEVTERERRSLGAGVQYSSSEGAGTRFYWEHRNIFGRAERLRADAVVAELRQELSGSFLKPNIWQPDQELRARAGIKHEDSKAFEEQTIDAFLGLERKWLDNWTIGAGTSFEYSIIDDQDGEETFALAGLPLTARYDTSNDVLDPTSGVRIGTAVTPFMGVLLESTNFLRADVKASAYTSVLDEDRLVLAARGRFGTIAGEETDDIPATKRFYAGGGGSVRGYEFRTLGPLDEDDDPLGGRSVVELGFELRIKVTEDIGVVPFVEGGNVFDDELPELDEELQWAGGLGFRYYTAVGPLRLDVAVPINRRSSDIDDAFQFYISLGQAF